VDVKEKEKKRKENKKIYSKSECVFGFSFIYLFMDDFFMIKSQRLKKNLIF
jgi:hypothetical protein